MSPCRTFDTVPAQGAASVIESTDHVVAAPGSLTPGELARWVRGDAAYLADITKRYDASLQAITSRHRLTPAEAREVIQDAWVRAYLSRGRFRNTGSFGGWIGRILSQQLPRQDAFTPAGQRHTR